MAHVSTLHSLLATLLPPKFTTGTRDIDIDSKLKAIMDLNPMLTKM